MPRRPVAAKPGRDHPALPGVPVPVRRRLLLAAFAVVAVLGIGGVGLVVQRTGTLSPNGWIRTALVAFADAWLVPSVSVGGFALESPTTVALRDLSLRHEGEEVLHCDRVAVSFADLPERGQPLTIARIELDHPVFRFLRDTEHATWKPLGFNPLLEPGAVADPESLARQHRPSEVLDLRMLRIRGGELVFDDRENPPLRIDGIDVDLDATPTVGPGGASGHQLAVSFGQPPGLEAVARGFVDLDARFVYLEEGRFTLDLSDPQATAHLSEGLRAAVARHEIRGRVELAAQGALYLSDPLRSTATFRADVEDLHMTAGALRVPIEEAHLEAVVAESLARIDRAMLRLPTGSASLTQGDVAVLDREVALAADWELDALPLHAFLAQGSPTESVATGSGRLFLSSDDWTAGLRIAELTVGEPGRPPTVALGASSIEGAALHIGDDAHVQVEAVRLDGMRVVVSRTPQGALRGLPVPTRAPAADPARPSLPSASPVRVRSVELTRGRVQLDRAGGAWVFAGVSAQVGPLGLAEPAALSLRIAPESGVLVQGAGTLGLSERRIALSSLSASGPLDSAGLRSLLPPGTREAVESLLPRGQVVAQGSADMSFAGGGTRLSLDATLSNGRGRLTGLTLPIDNGTAALRITDGAVDVERVRLSGAGGTLSIPAASLSAQGALQASWVARTLDLKRITTATGAPLGVGRLDSTGQIAGRIAGGSIEEMSVVDADLVVDDGPDGQMRWPSINVHVGPASGTRRLTARLGGLPGTRVDLKAVWPPGTTRLDVESLQGTVDLATEGRRGLPLFAQRSLADLREGMVHARVSGTIPLEDPVAAGRLTGMVELSSGRYRWGDWQVPRVEASLPVTLASGSLRTQDARVELLSGTAELSSAQWSILSHRGSGAARFEDLRLDDLEPKGPAARAIGGRLNGRGEVSLGLFADGLTVTDGGATVSIREGRLLELPTLKALAKADGKQETVGDDEVDLRMSMDDRGVRMQRLALDLGPIRYVGEGEVRWTGGIDLALQADRDRKGLADLAARLVAWRVDGTTAQPRVQALPMGVDTRTFAQKAADPYDPDALDALDDEALDELASPAERQPTSGEDDDADFNLDDFDDWQ